MERPEENDDKYYPMSIRENMEWFICDLEIYIDYLEEKRRELEQLGPPM